MSDENQTSTWVKFVFILGCFFQVGLTILLFQLFKNTQFVEVIPQLQFVVSLLSALMLAVPLGFLLANFVFHHAPFFAANLKNANDYKGTQKLLLRVLALCVLFLGVIIMVLKFIF